MSRKLPVGYPIDLDVFNEAVEVLLDGGIVGLPTDTVYGIAARADDAAAVTRLFEVKKRTREIAFPVLIGSFEVARKLARFTPISERLASQYWPGPLTIVLTRRAGFEADLGGNPASVGLRIPDEQLVRDLAERCGPLAVTSANLSGEPEALVAEQAWQSLGESVDLYLSGSLPSAGRPSTVVDARAGLKILRQGLLDLGLSETGMS